MSEFGKLVSPAGNLVQVLNPQHWLQGLCMCWPWCTQQIHTETLQPLQLQLTTSNQLDMLRLLADEEEG